MAQKLTDDKKEILQDLDGDDLLPATYWMMTRPPPNAPPGPEATVMPDPGPGEVPAAAAAPPPALLENVERGSALAGSYPSDGNLWSTSPGFHLSRIS